MIDLQRSIVRNTNVCFCFLMSFIRCAGDSPFFLYFNKPDNVFVCYWLKCVVIYSEGIWIQSFEVIAFRLRLSHF